MKRKIGRINTFKGKYICVDISSITFLNVNFFLKIKTLIEIFFIECLLFCRNFNNYVSQMLLSSLYVLSREHANCVTITLLQRGLTVSKKDVILKSSITFRNFVK